MNAPARVWLAAGLVWAAAACDQPAPPVEGVGPSGNARATQPPAEKPVELARPEPSPAPAPAAPAPKPAPAAQVRPVDLADLGPIQVMTWEEARLQAELRITAETADAELARLASELESGP